MQLKPFITFSILLLSTQTFARLEKFADENVLNAVSNKLTQIEAQLKNQRVIISAAQFSWSEYESFQNELMFVVAHDPSIGQKTDEIPADLSPGFLTGKLKETWNKLETSVLHFAGLEQSAEWISFKTDFEQFIKYREEYLYQPARQMIKSGELAKKSEALKKAAMERSQFDSTTKHYSVRVMDPVIENLSKEMNQLNLSIRQIKELREPPKVEKKTIYKEELYPELGIFAAACACVGMFFMLALVGLVKVFKKKKIEPAIEVNDGFDYSGWLKKFETNLRNYKNVEDKIVENHLEMKQVSDELREARKKLNQSDNQQDFYQSLDLLNNASPRMEEYFEKVNLKKGTEASRKMVHSIVELCQVIESGQNIKVTEQKKFKLIKNEQPLRTKSA